MDIVLQILNDMTMNAFRLQAGHEGDHNWVRFIVKRPSFLDGYICRSDFSGAITSYIIVDTDSFLLPRSLAKAGNLNLQLIYIRDDGEVVAKTNIVTLNVGESINAVDPEDTEFQDGLAQLIDSSFAMVDVSGNAISFYNRAGELRGNATLPTGSGTIDLSEIESRLDGLNSELEAMQDNVTALQGEATAKWVLLNTVDNRSRTNETNIGTLQNTIGTLNDILAARLVGT